MVKQEEARESFKPYVDGSKVTLDLQEQTIPCQQECGQFGDSVDIPRTVFALIVQARVAEIFLPAAKPSGLWIANVNQ